MTWEIAFIFVVLAAALALFITERYPVDQVAILIPIVLLLAGILTPEEAVSGFSATATVTVAAMLALSLGLTKTGVIDVLGRWARTARLGGPRLRLMLLCMLVAAVSAFLNNTAVVVIFLPIFLAMAEEAGEPPSLYLMPLSFAAILGGTVTLIGTSTNLIVYGMARARGYDELTMFSIAPLGIAYLAIGLAYLFTVGRKLLPRRTGQGDLSDKYDFREFMTELVVTDETASLGSTLATAGWGEAYGVSVVGLGRGDRTLWGPVSRRRLRSGDILYVQGNAEDLLLLAEKEHLSTPAQVGDVAGELVDADALLAEVLVVPISPLVGRTLKEERFQQRYDVTVLAVQHHGRMLRSRLAEVRIEAGDLLLVHGTADALEALAERPGFAPLGEVTRPAPDRARALVAMGILAAVVVSAGFEFVSILFASVTGVVLMIFTRCVSLEEIYNDLDWMVVFLLAGVIPLGIAMDQTGAAGWLGEGVAGIFGPLGPTAVVAAFYLLTSVLTAAMSNNAAAVVMTPIALLTAVDLGMNPYALLVAVMFGASADFMTPVGYQTNTLIYSPGGYRFSDYPRVGGPLQLLLIVTAIILIPIFWPS